MVIISYSEVADFIGGWVTSTNYKLQVIVDSVNWYIYNYIGYDISSWNKTDVVKICDITNEWAIFLNSKNVKEVVKINGVDYSGIKWYTSESTYRIVNWRKVVIDDLSNYLADMKWLYFEIEYSAWLATIPADLKYAWLLMASIDFWKDWWKDIKSYKLWPRSVTFETEWTAEQVMTIKNILNKYKIINIK